jgi:hypothetical protein
VTRDVKSSVAAEGCGAAGAGLGAARDGWVVGAGVTPAGGLDAAAGGGAAVGGGAVGVFGRVSAGVLLADAGGFGAGAAAWADGDAGALGADAGAGAADGAGADCGACAGDGAGGTGAETCPLFTGAGATACGGSAAALGASVGGDLTAAQPPAARQHSAIAQRDASKRPIIELPATASDSPMSPRITSRGEYHERTVGVAFTPS